MSDEIGNEVSTEVADLTEDMVSTMSTDDKRAALEGISEEAFNEVMDMAEEGPQEEDPADENSMEFWKQKALRQEQEARDWQLKHDRMGTELGEKKKALADQERMLEDSIREMEEDGFTNIASEGFGAIDKRNQAHAELERNRQQQQMLQYQENERQTRGVIESRIGDVSDQLVDGVRQALIADGVPEAQAKTVNVFGMPRELAFNLFKRAQAETENAQLRQELSALKGGGAVLAKIQKAAKAGGSVRGSAGTSVTQGESLTQDMVNGMSLEQKKALLSKIQRQRR